MSFFFHLLRSKFLFVKFKKKRTVAHVRGDLELALLPDAHRVEAGVPACKNYGVVEYGRERKRERERRKNEKKEREK